MNSEELEVSLRHEFESYLKKVTADLETEVSGLREKLEAEIEKHKAGLGSAFEEFLSRGSDVKELDPGFVESVTEHLRLAKDEGARITAMAMAEAEDLKAEQELQIQEGPSLSDLRDAINEISTRASQSEILKSLVDHASEYTPRGAFFIVKSEHLVGWRVFGTEEHPQPDVVREVFFPLSEKTLPGESIAALATVIGEGGGYDDDRNYLNELGFDQAKKMYAIPLVARGRGVAVLYADTGPDGKPVNVEALEMLVSIAGLTVELLAASNEPRQPQAPAFVVQGESADSSADSAPVEFPEEYPSFGSSEAAEPVTEEIPVEDFSGEAESETVDTGFEMMPAESESEEAEEPETEEEFEAAEEIGAEDVPAPTAEFEAPETADTAAEEEFSGTEEPSGSEYPAEAPEEEQFAETFVPEEEEAAEVPVESEDYYEVSNAVEVTDQVSDEPAQFGELESEPTTIYDDQYVSGEVEAIEPEDYDTDEEPVQEDVLADAEEHEAEEIEEEVVREEEPASAFSFEQTPEAEPAVATESAPVVASGGPIRTRFGDRNVDLPIEVSEEERRFHNDARRFARLLVSEIELYNKDKVKEGREAKDLYDRLREAIDRSREMYDKRVQEPVAAKFDYFDYEIVNRLADGDETKLGSGYPGSTV